MIGKASGAKGWDMFGYIAGGAVIGGLSGGAAWGISALGGGAMLAGAGAGTISGAGFSGLVTNWNANAMIKGGFFGAISGVIGGGVGAMIGGGTGAFVGGVSANITNQLLYNKGDFSKVNLLSAGLSGAISFGLYHGMSYLSYKQADLPTRMTYRQYNKINIAYQRSRFWHREYGVYLNNDGSAQVFQGNKYDVEFKIKSDTWGTAHTHWDKGGRIIGVDSSGENIVTVGGHHSSQDLNIPKFSLVIGRATSTYSYMGGFKYYQPDPFLRFFLFPWLKNKKK